MDEFFQKLREIQKKERTLSGLAPVGERFYGDVSDYLNVLMRKIDNNPFSFESYLLRDAQRITAEICERREHKISNSAVMNVQRSYQLFKESKAQLQVNVPRNSTPEEEKLYRALVSSLVTYREKLIGPIRSYTSQNHKSPSEKSEIIIKKDKPLKNDLNSLSAEFEHEDDSKEFSSVELDIERDIYKRFGHEPSDKVSKSPNKSENNENIQGNKINKNKLDKEDIKKESSQSKNNFNVQEAPTEILMILEELPSIMGVDEKVYGPLSPQDVISMPQPNARILIKNQKGRSIQRYK
ncbi:MAG: hypothetical protein LUQ70_01280 [Methanobacteriaceae archaeon]|nr:hypothetical protein [Methanobacteriaceae archaeon]